MAISLAISGAGGRMGRRIAALALADPDFSLTQVIQYPGHPLFMRPLRELDSDLDCDLPLTGALDAGVDVLIDVSTPDGTVARANEATGHNTAFVVGATGLAAEHQAAVNRAALTVPVVQAASYSVGVNVLLRVAADVAGCLGADFEVEIVEAHHHQKADAPSGMALTLAETVCKALERDPARELVHGRRGRPGARTTREVGLHALRMGSVVGEHTIHFSSPLERIELTHRAQTRDVFAAGALTAAKWVAGRPPGHYGMDAVLFGADG